LLRTTVATVDSDEIEKLRKRILEKQEKKKALKRTYMDLEARYKKEHDELDTKSSELVKKSTELAKLKTELAALQARMAEAEVERSELIVSKKKIQGMLILRLYWRFHGFVVVPSADGTTTKPWNLQYNIHYFILSFVI
jgi:hypothetical protein